MNTLWLRKRNILVLMGLLALLVLANCKESDAEADIMNANAVSNYAASISMLVRRMILNGVAVEELRFNSPDTFDTLDDPRNAVFHPEGGGALYKSISSGDPYRPVPGSYMADGKEGYFLFNGELQIEGIDRPDLQGESELTAYLKGISENVCASINKEQGVTGIPKLMSDQSSYYSKQMANDGKQDYVLPDGAQPVLDNFAFKEKATGCFEEYSGGGYVFYWVLIGR